MQRSIAAPQRLHLLTSMTTLPSTFRLLLWPSLITLAISCLRLTGEVQGWLHAKSGGGGQLLGIAWCMFVFGAWFATRLARAGSTPRFTPTWPFGVGLLLLQVGSMMWAFGNVSQEPPIDDAAREAAMAVLRASVTQLAICTSVLGACAFVIWPRLCWTLLLYGLGARATVVALTWLAKTKGWDTHYTKFGPQGFERAGMADTMVGASLAQFGIWVPLTIVTGTFAGAWFARRRAA